MLQEIGSATGGFLRILEPEIGTLVKSHRGPCHGHLETLHLASEGAGLPTIAWVQHDKRTSRCSLEGGWALDAGADRTFINALGMKCPDLGGQNQ